MKTAHQLHSAKQQASRGSCTGLEVKKTTGAKNLDVLAEFTRVGFLWVEKVANGVAKD